MKENIYTQENYNLILDTLKNIKQETHSLKDEDKNNYTRKIYNTLNEIEDEVEIKPSFKNFLNKMINQENIEHAKNEIIQEIIDKEIIGYSPDLKTLIEKICNEENLNKLKKHYIKQFENISV